MKVLPTVTYILSMICTDNQSYYTMRNRLKQLRMLTFFFTSR